ncbi:MAG: glycosyltransferase family 2 protein, partial [Patescibacteria group bacterium]|nr:glycosyltransferase family 2 protein [Patescibacteria group bacterium]
MCTHNREKLLPRALDSVLSQDFKDFELIIIDDASSDGTEALIKDYIARDNRIKYFRNKFNRGITKSRNRGCEIAESEYI